MDDPEILKGIFPVEYYFGSMGDGSLEAEKNSFVLENIEWEHAVNDPEAMPILQAAFDAVLSARKDGQKSGKHKPESWKEESIEEQAQHANDHAYTFLDTFQEPELFNNPIEQGIKEAQHALCRLAIAIALYERSQQNA